MERVMARLARRLTRIERALDPLSAQDLPGLLQVMATEAAIAADLEPSVVIAEAERIVAAVMASGATTQAEIIGVCREVTGLALDADHLEWDAQAQARPTPRPIPAKPLPDISALTREEQYELDQLLAKLEPIAPSGEPNLTVLAVAEQTRLAELLARIGETL
jgi:hypothetical protein